MLPLTFTCRQTCQPFRTSKYRITDNHGVVIDHHGASILDAKLTPDMACPFCGSRHVYRAADLPCPFPSQPSLEPPDRRNDHS